MEVTDTLVRVSSADIKVRRASNGSIILTSNTQIKVVNSYLIANKSVIRSLGGGIINGELVLPRPSQDADTLLVILEGGRFLEIPLNSLENPASTVHSLNSLGYKIAIGLLYNYNSYVINGPIHVRSAQSQPPSSADLNYKPILQGNVVFYLTGLTFNIASGNYWEMSGDTISLYPNKAISSVSTNPATITQVFRVLRGRGDVNLSARILVKVVNTSLTGYYPQIAVVCYVLDEDADLQLPVAIFQPPATNYLPWVERKVLYLSPPGELGIDYSDHIELTNLPDGSYILVGVEVLTYGLNTKVVVSIYLEG